MRGTRFLVLAVAIGLVGACSSSGTRPRGKSPASAPSTVPGAAWTTVPPATAGFDATKLDAIARVAETGSSNCLVVTRDGRIAGEWYFRGTNASTAQDVYSVTKSITSTLVGIAQDDGKLRVDDPASKWITEWQGTPSASVSIRDLLGNDSGREWSPAIDYRDLLQAPDRTAFAIGLGQPEPPGRVWAYNNSAIQTLQRVLQHATGDDVVEYAKRRLFDPLGMTETTMTRDRAGNGQMFEGVRSTCRDMARFGTLMLDDGRWGDRQVVSAAWVHAATGARSQPLNAGYGYLWWLNHEGAITDPLVATSLQDAQSERAEAGPSGPARQAPGAGTSHPTTEHGRIAPGAPKSMYWALGLGNQVVQVDPASRTVVVRLGTGTSRPKPPTFGPLEASKVVTEAVTGPGR